MKIKVCGIRHHVEEVSCLRPDYLGFIFWDSSPRYFNRSIPPIPEDIQKTGVFVNASLETIRDKVLEHGLDTVQLHGAETVDFLRKLRDTLSTTTKVTKVFSVGTNFDFSALAPFEDLADYFLFDTKGPLPGGNGYAFDWTVLKEYPFETPYFLSGGIGPGHLAAIRRFIGSREAAYCHALDVNSGFEIKPGEKDLEQLKMFITHIHAMTP